MPKQSALRVEPGRKTPRKTVDLGPRVGGLLSEFALRVGEPETTVARVCLEFGLDELKKAGFRLHKLGHAAEQ